MLLPMKSITGLKFFDYMKGWGNNMLATYVRLDNKANLEKLNRPLIDNYIVEQSKDQPKRISHRCTYKMYVTFTFIPIIKFRLPVFLAMLLWFFFLASSSLVSNYSYC